MLSLQKIVWFSLSGVTFFPGTTGFVEFLAPQEKELIYSDSTYIIKWAATSRNGRGTMTLLGGQTPEALREIQEIAHSVNVAGGGFSWTLEVQTLGVSLSSFYGLNFSLDGSEGVFSISPLFNIVSSRDYRADDDDIDAHDENGHDEDDENEDDDHENGRDEDDVDRYSVRNGDAPDTTNLGTPTSSPSSPTTTSTMTTGEVSTSSSSDRYIISDMRSRHSGNTTSPTQNLVPGPRTGSTASPAQNLVSGPRIGSGAIAGIAVGATTALAAFSSLIGLILYYRRRLSSGKGPSNPEQSRYSKIYGMFRKAELDAEGPQIAMSRVYELDATREIQEMDGKMKPIELDSNPVLRSEPSATSVPT